MGAGASRNRDKRSETESDFLWRTDVKLTESEILDLRVAEAGAPAPKIGATQNLNSKTQTFELDCARAFCNRMIRRNISSWRNRNRR